MERKNAIIDKIGYKFDGRANRVNLAVYLALGGSGCAFSLCDESDICQFFRVCFGDMDLTNGVFAEDLKGKPLCAWFGEKRKIVGVSHILDDNGVKIVNIP